MCRNRCFHPSESSPQIWPPLLFLNPRVRCFRVTNAPGRLVAHQGSRWSLAVMTFRWEGIYTDKILLKHYGNTWKYCKRKLYVYGRVTWAISNHWKPDQCTARDLLWLSARLRLGRQGLFHHRQVLPLLEVPITTTGRTPGIVWGDAFLGRTNQIAEICWDTACDHLQLEKSKDWNDWKSIWGITRKEMCRCKYWETGRGKPNIEV